jgi:hypothetical protein
VGTKQPARGEVIGSYSCTYFKKVTLPPNYWIRPLKGICIPYREKNEEVDRLPRLALQAWANLGIPFGEKLVGAMPYSIT